MDGINVVFLVLALVKQGTATRLNICEEKSGDGMSDFRKHAGLEDGGSTSLNDIEFVSDR